MVKATDYTFPEARGKCGFCGKAEAGYAKKDAKGEWQSACWPCVRPASSGAAQSKRQTVGTIFTSIDDEKDDEKPTKKKNPGIAPSNYRPKVN
jgi:hypothetical protein